MPNDPLIRAPLGRVSGLLRNAVFSAAFVAASITSSHAAILFTANLTNDQEVPSAIVVDRPASYGTASFQLNDDQTALTFTAVIYNIDFTGTQTADPNDDLRAAHIHSAPAGVNGPVIWGFFGLVSDNNPNDLVITPFVGEVGGMISGKWDELEGANTTLADQLPNLLAGNTYMNFHTVAFPAGEIRGQILRVPEPGSLALLGLGIGLAGIGARRRVGASGRRP